ncbi:Transmembrane amino acid transporter protein [Trichostrongylus colubriformis]|uniref:Transmembrane amino acid transporter protein n=1 Tax=Trichostrongylus colubriformis TaxID=6319 RepID=A0AAN8FGZ4_TRICO
MTFSPKISDVTERSEKSKTSVEPVEKTSEKHKKISATFALVNLMKGMVGPGCLSLPLAFKQGGLWASFAVDFLLGIISIICMMKIVKCAQFLCKRNKCGTLDYGQMAEAAFASSYKPLVRFRLVARWFVNFCLIFLQIGILSVYYIFVVDHAKEELATARHIPTSQLPAFTNVNGIVMAAGSILYSLEGQAMVLPLENKMKHPEDMDGLNGVLSTGVSLVTLIYAACGFYGYITYGNNVQGSVTLNLSDTPLNLAVKCMLLCVVYSSFLIQQYPIVEMLWPLAKRPLRARNTKRVYIIALEYLFRFSIAIVALGLAWLIPNLDQIIPLIGVTAGMLLALVLPAILEIVVFIEEWRANCTTFKLFIHIGLDCFYAILGLFFLVTGLQANIKNLMQGESS